MLSKLQQAPLDFSEAHPIFKFTTRKCGKKAPQLKEGVHKQRESPYWAQLESATAVWQHRQNLYLPGEQEFLIIFVCAWHTSATSQYVETIDSNQQVSTMDAA